ncbi:MAG TPA: putative toxin-antitoxin system toxin component, PIN family [Leeuwenhoekiella sp.]|nr:putative toxin-antitoxin system toxin component, PIN family [Leeuwenhoekiella sp.]
MIKLFVFDTSSLISAFLFPNSIPRKALNKAINSGILVLSTQTYSEFEDVILRSKFDRYLIPLRKQEALNKIRDIAFSVNVQETITDCRDFKDNKFLELAVSASDSCIITGDEDLLVLNPFRSIPILNVADFLIEF